MKKALFVGFMFLFLGVFASTVHAQSGASGSASLIPAQECGYADAAPPGNKCCFSDAEINIKLPQTGLIVFDAISSALNSLLNTIVNGIFGGLSREVKDAIVPFNKPCFDGTASLPNDPGNASCLCIKAGKDSLTELQKLCDPISNPAEVTSCKVCQNGGGVWTSLGCVDSNLSGFIQNMLLGWGIGLAGGMSMLCIIYAAFMMQTSGGNAEKVKKAQQLLTACITGLMLIIFSVLILNIIGVKILRIPGFS